MSVRNLQVQNYDRLIKKFKRNKRWYLSSSSAEQEFFYKPDFELPRRLERKIRSGNIYQGTVYDGIPAAYEVDVIEEVKNLNILTDTYTNVRIIESGINRTVVAYDATGYDIIEGLVTGSAWLLLAFDYFFASVQEYDANSNSLFDAPTDFEVVDKSPNELEDVYEKILLVSVGSGCIEILIRRSSTAAIDGKFLFGTVFHRYLSEGWKAKYGPEMDKQFYTDIVLDQKEDFVQGDENRNSALAALAPVVLENAGFDAGNLGNDILDNLKFFYYTKPIASTNAYSFDIAYSFDGGTGSIYSETGYNYIHTKNVASILNDPENTDPILFNTFFEIPQGLDDFNYLYFNFDFSTLVNLKNDDRSIITYLNNEYTGGNFSSTSTSIVKVNGRVLFDSIGLFDLRYYDKKVGDWMSTNIVSRTYYNDLYGAVAHVNDPLKIVRNAIYETDGYDADGDGSDFLAAEDINYNPFFDYSNCTLTIGTNDIGGLDYSKVELKIAVTDGFKYLVTSDDIICDEKCKLNYALTSIDNPFEKEDKSISISESFGKKLLWLSTPPIVQHVGNDNSIPSISQFRVIDDTYGPSDMTIQFGAPLHGKFPVDIFRCLKSIIIE